MKYIQEIELQMDKKCVEHVLVKQGDSGRYLSLNIFDNDGTGFNLTGKSVRFHAKKPDGKEIFNDCKIIDAKNGQAEVQLTNQTLACEGTAECEAVINDSDGKTLSTMNFYLDIDKNQRNEDAIESTNEFSVLDRALAQTEKYNKYYEETSGKLEEKYTTRLNNRSLAAFFFKYLKTATTIDLYGDSITAGQGAAGHEANGQVIFTKGDEVYKEGCTTCNCWANLFRRWIAKNYPGVTFTNRGIGGKTAVWSNTNKENLVKTGDIAFIQLGTNDRWYTKPADFKTNLKEFIEYVKVRYKLVIIMSATPCRNDDSTVIVGKPAIFKSNDVDRLVTEVCEENEYYYISNYRPTFSYCERKGLNFKDLFESSGSHPLDLGHKYIWDNIKKNLGINDDEVADSRLTYNTFQTVAVERYIQDYNYGMTIENGDFSTFAPAKNGTRITFKCEDKAFGFQLFKAYSKPDKFWIRNATGYDSWGDWTSYVADAKQYQDRQYEVEVPIEKLPVGYTAVKITSQKGVDSTTHILQVLPISTLEKNVIFSYTAVENSNTVYVRFYNMGATEVTVNGGKFKVLLNFIGRTN